MNVRTYGSAPFSVAVIHGGPGAPGEMAPVARQLARDRGVLEPLQTAASVEGQVRELRDALEQHGTLPMTLIGYSWGALLGFIVAARYPACVRKLILVGSAPFEERFAAQIMETRLSRLSEGEQLEVQAAIAALDDRSGADKRASFARLGSLLSKADGYDPIPSADEPGDIQYDIYESVWHEAAELRASGQLLALAADVQCPVVAIHGDYDPHPAEGVAQPLRRVLREFKLVLLKQCGHTPWLERTARDRFYAVLREELAS